MRLVYEGLHPTFHDACKKMDEVYENSKAGIKEHLWYLEDGTIRLKIFERAIPKPKLPRWIPRTCADCKKPLIWQEYLAINKDKRWTRDQLKKIWNDSRVQISCCTCTARRIKET